MAKIQPKKNLNVAEQEKVLQTLYQEDNKKSGTNKVRVTIDFSQMMHEQIKNEMDYTGQTIKGFVTTLIREYFEKNQR